MQVERPSAAEAEKQQHRKAEALPLASVQVAHAQRAATPPASVKPPHSPLTAKRSRMVKSFSQDAGGSIQSAAASAAAAVVSGGDSHGNNSSGAAATSSPSSMTQSVSEGQLQKHQHQHHYQEGSSRSGTSSSVGSGLSSLAGANMLHASSSKPSVVDEAEEFSCSASESGSLADLPMDKALKLGKDGAKKRSFFHFRKKEKKDLM